jgi:acetolactate synthase-1/2/3 large subunit
MAKTPKIRDLSSPAQSATPSIQHPLAGKKMSGAEMIVQVLADEGVSTIFGYSGGAILPTYDAVFCFNEDRKAKGEPQMPLIVPANEQGAGFMAAGYARASGRVGVAIVTSGPGATNTVTPIRDSMADSIPMVVICGQVPRSAIGSDAFQEAPVPSIMGSVAKHIFLVTDTEKLEATVRTAFEIARTGRPGPVVIDIPKDVQNWTGEFKGTGTLPMPGYRKRLETLTTDIIDGTEANHFFEMLGESQRPLIYAGGGVINGNASAELREFAEAFEIPVVTTLMGIGAVDTSSALDAHAGHARRGLRQLRGRRLRFPDHRGRALRRPRRRQPGEVRPGCQVHRALRHRSRGDQQGQARAVEPRRHAARGAAHAHRARRAHGLQA